MAPRINLPPLTRILLLVNIGLSVLNASIRLNKWRHELDSLSPTEIALKSNYLSNPQWGVSYLALVPTKSIRYPWTFITAAWVENNILSLAISGSVIWFGGKYLERAWGSLLALEAGFLVALKQLVPEHTVSLFRGALRVRIKHFPALFTLANMISGPLLGTDTALWLSLLGFMTGWIYLRFFRVNELSGGSSTGGEGAVMKGDASDTFAFMAFFPDAMHPFLSPVCDAVYATLVSFKIFTPFSEEAVEAGNENVASRSEGLPSIMNGEGGSGRRAEAERRRALALKALDQRLNAAAATRTASAPVASMAPTVAAAGDAAGTAVGAEENVAPPA
ncbi:hypothetical protein B0A55_04874 [Friedmanniomyces simplex]|uniref:Uncharacterized protein n=1 Tax=Friedmanniomyces simplex TaxID=329884 RepID=A0A4U0XEU5_9PEZI|nr:hypothetical protein B0A55_04874 [Friedmanniomyces simplex]